LEQERQSEYSESPRSTDESEWLDGGCSHDTIATEDDDELPVVPLPGRRSRDH